MRDSAASGRMRAHHFPFAITHERFLKIVDDQELGMSSTERKREAGEPIPSRSIQRVRFAMRVDVLGGV